MTRSTEQLGNLAEIQGGLQVSHAREELPVEVPYLRVANVFRDHFDLTEVKTMRVTAPELERVRLQANDILVVEGHGNPAEVGRTSVWQNQVVPCVHQNHLIRVRLNPERAFAPYVSAYLNSPQGRQHLIRSGKTTSGLNTINITNVREAPVPVPPLPEQKRIAAILDKADAIRRKRQEAIRLTEELLRAAFLDMFGDPVTNPKGWPLRKLGEVASNKRHAMAIGPFGSDLKTSDYTNEGVPVVFVKDIASASYTPKSGVFISRQKAEELSAHAALPGDVLVTKMGTPPGIAAAYPEASPPAVITADIIKLSPNKALASTDYLVAAINSQGIRNQVRRITNGVTRAKVTLGDFRTLEVLLPPIAEQQRWSTVRAAMGRHRNEHVMALVEQERLAQVLTHRAFSGRL